MLGVLLGLACALLWGSGDFTGGFATRRNHALQVLVVASFSGLLMLTVFALVSQEGLPSSKTPQQSRCLRSKVLIGDKPGSSGMTPGCDSREDNDLRGSGDTIVVQDF